MPPASTQDAESEIQQRRDEHAGPTFDRREAERDVDLSLDRVFDILRSERRRHAIEYLLTGPEQTTLGELSVHIATLENDKPAEEVTSKERKRAYVGLYQCHLPKLDDADVIDFDGDRKTIELGPNVDELEPYLELAAEEAEEDGRNWAPYYLATSLLGGLLLVVQALLFPIAWLSTVLLEGLVLAYFGLSIAHARLDGLSLRRAIGR